MKPFSAIAALAALSLAGAAQINAASAQEDASAPNYIVIEADAHIPATREINHYEIVDAYTVLFRTGADRWYAAKLAGNCGRSARFDHTIGIDSGGAGRIDRFSSVVVEGRRCAIQSLSRIERTADEQPAPAQSD